MSAVGVAKSDVPAVDDPWRRIHERRRPTHLRRRGWLVRRMLLGADIAGLLVAFAAAEAIAGTPTIGSEWLVLLGLIPIWILMAKIYGLYDRDEERADHSTVDDVRRRLPPRHRRRVAAAHRLGALTGAADPSLARARDLLVARHPAA